MPSYIELDKQGNFPSSSNAGKVIFGVNASGEATITDNVGNTTIINTGGSTPTPCANDFIQLVSYSNWVQGNNTFGTGGDVDKFTALAQDNDPGDYLQLKLVSGQVNGINLSTCPSYSINLTAADITYRDDGFGTYPANYVDFLNGVFASHSLYTRLTGSNNNFNKPNNLVADYCKVDNFFFTFEETGQLSPSSLTSPIYFSIKSEGGAVIRDVFNSSEIDSVIQINQGSYWSLV